MAHQKQAQAALVKYVELRTLMNSTLSVSWKLRWGAWYFRDRWWWSIPWATYNLKENFFEYHGVPTSRTTFLLEEIADMYGVYILVAVQATHTFDVNGCDALLHSAQKKRMRSFFAPLKRNILYGTGNALVKRFVILELFRDASCGHSVGMRTVRSMRAWSP